MISLGLEGSHESGGGGGGGGGGTLAKVRVNCRVNPT